MENKELESTKMSVTILFSIITYIAIISIFCGCGTVEYAYSEASWATHTLHFQNNIDLPNCEWCIDYNKRIP